MCWSRYDVKVWTHFGVWQVLVASHKAWLKLQRCKDRFEPLLSLGALKCCSEKPSSAAAPTASTSAAVRNNSTAAGSGASCGAFIAPHALCSNAGRDAIIVSVGLAYRRARICASGSNTFLYTSEG